MKSIFDQTIKLKRMLRTMLLPSQTQLEAILKLLESDNHEQESLRIA